MPENPSELSSRPRDYFSKPRGEMLAFIPEGVATVLDVGCGQGEFGAAIKRRTDGEVWGIELDPAAAERARDKLDQVLAGDLQEKLQELPKGHFDCIVFNDVLEHLVNPYAVLKEVKSHLKPMGVVVCSLPNVRYCRVLFDLVVKKQWRYEDSGILDKSHLRFFTEKSIREMFDRLDYEIVKMKGINRTESWAVKLVNLLFLGWFSDTLSYQFACLVRPRQ